MMRVNDPKEQNCRPDASKVASIHSLHGWQAWFNSGDYHHPEAWLCHVDEIGFLPVVTGEPAGGFGAMDGCRADEKANTRATSDRHGFTLHLFGHDCASRSSADLFKQTQYYSQLPKASQSDLTASSAHRPSFPLGTSPTGPFPPPGSSSTRQDLPPTQEVHRPKDTESGGTIRRVLEGQATG